MARIRTIKPELPQDAKLAKLSRVIRLHFIYLLTVADDEGFFRAAPRLLLGLYPYDRDMGEAEVDHMTASLVEAGFLTLHHTDDGPIGRFANWAKHQKIDHASGSFLKKLVAQPSRKPREEVAKGVLSLESLSLDTTKAFPLARKDEQPQPAKKPTPDTSPRKVNETPGAERRRDETQGLTAIKHAIEAAADKWDLAHAKPAAPEAA